MRRLAVAVALAACGGSTPAAPPPPAPVANEGGTGEPPHAWRWHSEEVAAHDEARASGRGVLIFFTADWSAPAAELEQVLADPAVTARLRDWVPLRLDVTSGSDADEVVIDRYQAYTVPLLVFWCPNGARGRIERLVSRDELLAAIPPRCR